MPRYLQESKRSVHRCTVGVRPRTLVSGLHERRGHVVTFWENKADEKASLANIPHLVEGMSHVLASEEIYQDTVELVQDQHRIERSEEDSPT
jgi:hypothetical protein